MEPLSERLRSLGVHLGMPESQSSVTHSNYFPIESVINGSDLFNEFGRVFKYQADYPVDYRHGNTNIVNSVDLSVFAQFENGLENFPLEVNRMIFLDTETSGLAGGSGTFAFLVGLAHWIPGGFRLVQFFMRDPNEEQALLMELNNYLAAFNTLVTFNGKTFDIPILNTRHVINKQPSPFQEFAHIDLLHLARRLWRNRLASRALGNLEHEILNLQRSQNEVPGWMIPVLYSDYLRSQDARPLEGVFYHNGMDVISMAALLIHISSLLANPTDNPISTGYDQIAIACLYENKMRLSDAAALLELGIENDLPEPLKITALLQCAGIYRRQNHWEKAVVLWLKAADLKSFDAFVSLAKYYEHQQRDFSKALFWTDLGLKSLDSDQSPLYIKQVRRKDLLHRKKRLSSAVS